MKRSIFIIYFCTIFCGLSFAQAIPALTKAAEQGDIQAQLFLGKAYFEGKHGASRNIQESYRWYLAAANQNNAEAQYKVAMFKHDLNGSWDNDEEVREALIWMKKSADNGYAPAQENFAFLLMNMNEADMSFHYFTRAVDQQYLPAYTGLADCYYYGYGTERNLSEAKHLYKLAVDNGIAYANMGLGYCAREEGDYKSAKNYYQKAIDAGIIEGYNDMAYLYAQGQSVPKDFIKAHRLIDIAISKSPQYPNFL